MKMRILILGFLLVSFKLTYSQTDLFKIEAIEIVGNNKTKADYILRELDFTVGDMLALSSLQTVFDRNKSYLLGTRLFVSVDFELTDYEEASKTGIVQIKVAENLYWYLYPGGDLLDRSVIIWLRDFGLDFDRVVPSLTFSHTNLTGRQDELKARIERGFCLSQQDNLIGDLTCFGDFTRKYEVLYTTPYLNKDKTLRLRVGGLYSNSNSVRINTSENKDVFLIEEDRIQERFRSSARLEYRPKLYLRHWLTLRYQGLQAKDTIINRNPDYFLDGTDTHRFFSISYTFRLDRRDNELYPLKGIYFLATASKQGIGVFGDRNMLRLTGAFGKYWQFSQKLSTQFFMAGETNLIRQQQPFYDYRSIGTNADYIRGYENYAIDGQDYWYAKADVKYLALDINWNLGRLMPIKKLKQLPIQVFAKIYSDIGSVNDPYYFLGNDLNNEFLTGGGVGLDFIVYRSSLIQIEYSFNHLGESAFFAHFDLVF